MGTPINKDDVIFIQAIKSKLVIITCNKINTCDDNVLAAIPIKIVKDYQLFNPPTRFFKRSYDNLLHIDVKG